MESGKDNPSYFLSDGDKIRQKPGAASYNFSREPKRSGGVTRWFRQNQKRFAITSCVTIVILMILFLVFYFSLRSVPKKTRRHCHKFFEAEIITVEFECRWWKVYKNTLRNDLSKDNNQAQLNKSCNCTPLSTFWRWWNKHFSHFNNVLTKFQLVEDPECNLKNFPINTGTEHTDFKISDRCTTIILTVTTKNRSRDLALLTSNTGFTIILVDDGNKEPKFGKPVKSFQKGDLDDLDDDFEVIDKINSFFRPLDNCVGDFKMYYMKTSEYNRRFPSKGASRAEKSFLLYSENKYCVMLPELINEEKAANDFSEASKQLGIFAQVPNDNLNEIPLELNGYDPVHGVPNEKFARYYEELLHNDTMKKKSVIIAALRKLSLNNEARISYRACLKLWMSECFPTEDRKTFIVTIYNPSDHSRNIYIRLPVILGKYSVLTFKGENLPVQIKTLPESVINLKLSKMGDEQGISVPLLRELIFRAEDVPGYGFKSFYVSETDGPTVLMNEKRQERVKLILNPSTRKLVGAKIDGEEFFMESNLVLYESSYCGGTLSRFQVVEKGKEHGSPIKKGDILTEYEYVYEGLGSKIIRTYAGEEYLEVEWIFQNFAFFGEIAIQYNTSIDSKGIFYTGYETEWEEKRNHRSECSKNCLVNENCTIKYYPTQEVLIKDSSNQIFILTETSQSVTSPCPGTIEFSMLLKPRKDSFMSQKHWIFIGKTNDTEFQSKIQRFALKNKVEPLLFFSNPEITQNPFGNWSDKFLTELSNLSPNTSENVFIITFEPKKENVVWIRFKNIGDDFETFELTNFFPNFEIEAREIYFGTRFCSQKSETRDPVLCGEDFDSQMKTGQLATNVTLGPFEIKSFLFVMKPKLFS